MMLRWQLMAVRERVRMNHGRGFERDWDLESVHIERCWTSWLDRKGGKRWVEVDMKWEREKVGRWQEYWQPQARSDMEQAKRLES